MRPRGTPILANLPKSKLLSTLAEGMELIAEHVLTLELAADRLTGPGFSRAVAAIRMIADEEAAKYLILADAARAARQQPQVKVRQLKRCNSHIAKGVYTELAGIRPADLDEVISFINGLRASHYLDGPNDIDWIFRNAIEAGREERLYVDYVETDEGSGWITPQRFDIVTCDTCSAAVTLVAALQRFGCGTPDGLVVLDELWHDFLPTPKTHYVELSARIEMTLERWHAVGPSDHATAKDSAVIRDSWTFPLHGIEIERVDVKVEDLRHKQATTPLT